MVAFWACPQGPAPEESMDPRDPEATVTYGHCLGHLQALRTPGEEAALQQGLDALCDALGGIAGHDQFWTDLEVFLQGIAGGVPEADALEALQGDLEPFLDDEAQVLTHHLG